MPPTPDERPGIPGGPGGPGGPGTVTASKQNNQLLLIWFRNIDIAYRYSDLIHWIINIMYYFIFAIFNHLFRIIYTE